ncbi:uncharacterized protein BDW47DRAFT_101689 [Aspergillus candidus]|uniref:Uncharacterized protein n=1 Tax=Aspergillus candidus TaxID=41067 RepID=A0A2I2FI05_ASPCN|nr:hypothetical protein BDW47DRAFT_101689 [Aspergillus candidus]PLB40265.1 hypothetical protein BDW47DRAFT_101689 [Aspergillus candidus]
MSRKVPRAAFVEEYDEDARVIIPDTRQVANKNDLGLPPEPLLDVASDSGYSSRTAATVNSSQSTPSSQKPPGPLKVDTTPKRADLDRVRSTRKDRAKEKERTARPARDDSMQVGSYPSASHHHAAPMTRSPSRSRRRETAQVRHYPGTCWECDQGLYHGSPAADPKPMDYGYYMSQPSTPSVADYPSASRNTQRYAGPVIQDVNVSRSNRPHGRGNRSSSYQGPDRPMSFHGMMPGMGGGMMYHPQLGRYEHGPPLSSSAYAHTPAYASSPYGPQPQPQPQPQAQPQLPYYGPEYHQPQEHLRERSMSRTRDQKRNRRASVYGAPTADYDYFAPSFDDDDALEPPPPRESRQRMPSHSNHDRGDDYNRMPPPPLKHQSRPQIIQKRPDLPRKAATSSSVSSEDHPSRGGIDLSDLRDTLPEYGYRQSSGETVIPERRGSRRDSRRSQSYHDPIRPSRRIVENNRRRQPSPIYDYDLGSDEDDIDEKQREAEEYQATRSVKSAAPVPLTSDALLKAKSSHGAHPTASDSGSQKSRSNSSRGSDARTQNGSGVGSKAEEDNNIVMTMNGVTMSFTQESVGGKRISVRAGETGALELNIEGKRPKKYLTGGSDYTGTVARREADGVRRPRGDRRSDRASRRSSQSVYSGRF